MGRRALVAGGLVAVLGVLLAVWAFAAAWDNAGEVSLSVHGWIAMSLAFGLTGLIGGGLMWLAFYSARKGWDDIDRDS
jgi:hypothetical protein